MSSKPLSHIRATLLSFAISLPHHSLPFLLAGLSLFLWIVTAGVGVPLTDCLLLEKGACGPHSLSSDHRGQHGAQQANHGVCKESKPELHLGGVFRTPHMIQATSWEQERDRRWKEKHRREKQCGE